MSVRSLLFGSLLFFMTTCDRRVNVSDVIVRQNGMVLERTTERPFSGILIETYADGIIRSECRYVNGKREGTCVEWSRERKKISEQEYVGGREDGVGIAWYENGRVHVEAHFRDGTRDGLFTEYYPDGQKKAEGRFVNGQKEGAWTEWTASGEVSVVRQFVNGKETE